MIVETHHHNRLNEAETERLALLAEEMAEAIHAIGKILRHGYESTHPMTPKGPTNREWLEKEVAHVYVAARLMFDAGDIRHVPCAVHEQAKSEELHRYLHHQSTSF
ncbi:hypothetical protein [Burkholderia pseudomallei]|uniref:hypothetical protein n=1 Tax=Burkholderia pseudomallei TaxID=28450 RepID=UPI000A1A1CF3|nr:hypothetical protein [Burkholderia pseudomallei]ARK56284.1 hypothetical protein BOC36_24760 [Burkholderia pseudomallei]ARL25467.1 hypothetical protein BOC47_24140 [Burkholderia pseudomallei]ARL77579.1 hypothetical protein BOC54_36900 [Burkholderia pseudomallei]ARL84184.1 hypothetical protein BOC55_35225 [Burkholderia pseudomallei]